ncbi:hypothetical protein Q8W71_28330 [Methylobacterium sp. NEAU 140]|uniref:hypothetical protein n=1 Tax=Methylobacterium sp. NEAU 140 TaxID=3064945 RepID=UPI00273443E4|nr:hypothetical protein [Methylobacterium sp. NEAU 140]MDP4026529.1 hypothetical protein [Methylobacterium sp. NEAU 140]
MRDLGIDAAGLAEIEAAILADPRAHPMIRGLRGARKARFARPGRGKSGGGRVIYYVTLGDGLLAMLAAYAKTEKADLTAADRKAILAAIDLLPTVGDPR